MKLMRLIVFIGAFCVVWCIRDSLCMEHVTVVEHAVEERSPYFDADQYKLLDGMKDPDYKGFIDDLGKVDKSALEGLSADDRTSYEARLDELARAGQPDLSAFLKQNPDKLGVVKSFTTEQVEALPKDRADRADIVEILLVRDDLKPGQKESLRSVGIRSDELQWLDNEQMQALGAYLADLTKPKDYLAIKSKIAQLSVVEVPEPEPESAKLLKDLQIKFQGLDMVDPTTQKRSGGDLWLRSLKSDERVTSLNEVVNGISDDMLMNNPLDSIALLFKVADAARYGRDTLYGTYGFRNHYLADADYQNVMKAIATQLDVAIKTGAMPAEPEAAVWWKSLVYDKLTVLNDTIKKSPSSDALQQQVKAMQDALVGRLQDVIKTSDPSKTTFRDWVLVSNTIAELPKADSLQATVVAKMQESLKATTFDEMPATFFDKALTYTSVRAWIKNLKVTDQQRADLQNVLAQKLLDVFKDKIAAAQADDVVVAQRFAREFMDEMKAIASPEMVAKAKELVQESQPDALEAQTASLDQLTTLWNGMSGANGSLLKQGLNQDQRFEMLKSFLKTDPSVEDLKSNPEKAYALWSQVANAVDGMMSKGLLGTGDVAWGDYFDLKLSLTQKRLDAINGMAEGPGATLDPIMKILTTMYASVVPQGTQPPSATSAAINEMRAKIFESMDKVINAANKDLVGQVDAWLGKDGVLTKYNAQFKIVPNDLQKSVNASLIRAANEAETTGDLSKQVDDLFHVLTEYKNYQIDVLRQQNAPIPDDLQKTVIERMKVVLQSELLPLNDVKAFIEGFSGSLRNAQTLGLLPNGTRDLLAQAASDKGFAVVKQELEAMSSLVDSLRRAQDILDQSKSLSSPDGLMAARKSFAETLAPRIQDMLVVHTMARDALTQKADIKVAYRQEFDVLGRFLDLTKTITVGADDATLQNLSQMRLDAAKRMARLDAFANAQKWERSTEWTKAVKDARTLITAQEKDYLKQLDQTKFTVGLTALPEDLFFDKRQQLADVRTALGVQPDGKVTAKLISDLVKTTDGQAQVALQREALERMLRELMIKPDGSAKALIDLLTDVGLLEFKDQLIEAFVPLFDDHLTRELAPNDNLIDLSRGTLEARTQSIKEMRQVRDWLSNFKSDKRVQSILERMDTIEKNTRASDMKVQQALVDTSPDDLMNQAKRQTFDKELNNRLSQLEFLQLDVSLFDDSQKMIARQDSFALEALKRVSAVADAIASNDAAKIMSAVALGAAEVRTSLLDYTSIFDESAKPAENFKARNAVMDRQKMVLGTMRDMLQKNVDGLANLASSMADIIEGRIDSRMQPWSSEVKSLHDKGLIDDTGVVTSDGYAFARLADEYLRTNQRLDQIAQFIKDNGNNPPSAKGANRLAQDLRLSWLIPDDQVRALHKEFADMQRSPRVADLLSDFNKSIMPVYSDEGRTQLLISLFRDPEFAKKLGLSADQAQDPQAVGQKLNDDTVLLKALGIDSALSAEFLASELWNQQVNKPIPVKMKEILINQLGDPTTRLQLLQRTLLASTYREILKDPIKTSSTTQLFEKQKLSDFDDILSKKKDDPRYDYLNVLVDMQLGKTPGDIVAQNVFGVLTDNIGENLSFKQQTLGQYMRGIVNSVGKWFGDAWSSVSTSAEKTSAWLSGLKYKARARMADFLQAFSPVAGATGGYLATKVPIVSSIPGAEMVAGSVAGLVVTTLFYKIGEKIRPKVASLEELNDRLRRAGLEGISESTTKSMLQKVGAVAQNFLAPVREAMSREVDVLQKEISFQEKYVNEATDTFDTLLGVDTKLSADQRAIDRDLSYRDRIADLLARMNTGEREAKDEVYKLQNAQREMTRYQKQLIKAQMRFSEKKIEYLNEVLGVPSDVALKVALEKEGPDVSGVTLFFKSMLPWWGQVSDADIQKLADDDYKGLVDLRKAVMDRVELVNQSSKAVRAELGKNQSGFFLDPDYVTQFNQVSDRYIASLQTLADDSLNELQKIWQAGNFQS